MIGGSGKNPAAADRRFQIRPRILDCIKEQKMMRPGDRVGVAVSGGADSAALLLLLLELREKLGVVLSVVHFNHKLRGKASDADAKFVAKLAEKHGLEFHAASVQVAQKAKKEKTNLEDTARRARYDYFNSLEESGALTRIAVAHTADDQAETVLAHILRGTGITGLGGIHPVAGPIIRPLLQIRRKELRTYLRARKQKWREDATNRDTSRTRARIRRKLLPVLEKQFQPAIVEHLTTLADLAREDESFWRALVEKRAAELVREHGKDLRITAKDLLEPLNRGEEASALSKRLVRHAVKKMKPHKGQLGAGHVKVVLELARQGQSGTSLPLPGGVEVRRERDELAFHAFEKKSAANTPGKLLEFAYDIDLSRGAHELHVAQLGCVFRFKVIDWPPKRAETSRDGAVLDRDRLRLPLVLRNWRPGDRMRPLGHRNAHKLKRLLNEKRVSRWARDGWPVLTSGGILAWARGFHVAAEFAADERTRAGMVIAEEAL